MPRTEFLDLQRHCQRLQLLLHGQLRIARNSIPDHTAHEKILMACFRSTREDFAAPLPSNGLGRVLIGRVVGDPNGYQRRPCLRLENLGELHGLDLIGPSLGRAVSLTQWLSLGCQEPGELHVISNWGRYLQGLR